jgi:hypothetical protein
VKRVPIIASLNGGELSPLLLGRVDVEKFGTGAQTLENLIPKLQGPIERRGGSLFVGEQKPGTFTRSWLPKFHFNEQQAYVLEMGPEYLRFFTQRGQLTLDDAAYEIAQDYAADDLGEAAGTFRPSYVQSRDQVFFAAAAHPPKVLSRLGATSWTWGDLDLFGGPFKDQNEADIGVSLGAITEVGGTTTLTAGSPIFQAGHVGSLFEVEGETVGTTLWVTGLAVAPGSAIRWDGRYFLTTLGGTTGTIPPTHDSGTVNDGGVSWTYKHAGRTVVKITSYVSPTLVNVEIATPITGDAAAPNVTRKWSFGAWSDVEGWPTEVAFFRERLVFGRGTSIWLSCAGDYGNFSARTGGLITDENAISLQVANARADEIRWLQGAQSLLIGTAGGISILREQTAQLAFGPGNVTIIPGPVVGASTIPPLETPSGQVLYVDRTRTAIRAISYSADSDSFAAPDITRLAEHILRAGVVDIAYQLHRDSIVWALLENGELAALTYDAAEGVFAWARHQVAGPEAFIEAIQVIPCPDATNRRDDLWLLVRRTIEGVTKRYLEVLEAPYIPPPRKVGQTRKQWRSHASRDAKFGLHVDSGLAFDGARNGDLDIPSEALAIGEEVALAVTVGAITSADVGQIIQHDYTDATGFAQTAEALILSVTDDTDVAVRIRYPFPVTATASLPPYAWRVTRATLTGLTHLNGLEVAILADGGPRPAQTVTDGTITLSPPAAIVKAGLRYQHRFVSMPPETGAIAGTSQGRMKRAGKFILRMFASLGSRVGSTEEELSEVRELIPYRAAETIMGRPSPLFFGDAELRAPGGFDQEGAICVVGDEPLPFTLVAIIPHFEVHD